MSDWVIHEGDCREVLAGMDAASVHCCVTSPPYFGLRSYGTEPQVWGGDADCEHEWTSEMYYREGGGGTSSKQAFSEPGPLNAARLKEARWRGDNRCAKCGAWRGELGAERTVEAYVAALVDVFRAVKRVLRDDGTLWLVIGDSYGHGTSAQRLPSQTSSKISPLQHEAQGGRHGGQAKQLLGIPWRVAFALQQDGWWLRSAITWCKGNPMPESVTDRPTSATEMVFLLTKRATYFYDAEAIKEPNSSAAQLAHNQRYAKSYAVYDERAGATGQPGNVNNVGIHSRPGTDGRNKRNWWVVNTQPFPDAHFATYPPTLIIPCILAGTSERGACPACGAPWRRVSGRGAEQPEVAPSALDRFGTGDAGVHRKVGGQCQKWLDANPKQTTGWEPTCKCGAPEGWQDGDGEIVATPTGERVGDDPSLVTGRAGMNRPRGPEEGTRPITRHAQRMYADQLRRSPHRAAMEAEAGDAFAHYIRTDRSGARPIPPKMLTAWLERGWLTAVSVPVWEPPQPVPCTVLDPFTGSGTTGLVANRYERAFVGIELSPEYAAMARRRIAGDAPLLTGMEGIS